MHTPFIARVITGSGRGKTLGTPTLNVDLADVPTDMKEGIYACWAKLPGGWMKGALHYGPRPVFKDTPSCEVYLLDIHIEEAPHSMTIAPVGYIRPVEDFPSPEALMERIAEDVTSAHAMLDKHGPPLT